MVARRSAMDAYPGAQPVPAWDATGRSPAPRHDRASAEFTLASTFELVADVARSRHRPRWMAPGDLGFLKARRVSSWKPDWSLPSGWSLPSERDRTEPRLNVVSRRSRTRLTLDLGQTRPLRSVAPHSARWLLWTVRLGRVLDRPRRRSSPVVRVSVPARRDRESGWGVICGAPRSRRRPPQGITARSSGDPLAPH